MMAVEVVAGGTQKELILLPTWTHAEVSRAWVQRDNRERIPTVELIPHTG